MNSLTNGESLQFVAGTLFTYHRGTFISFLKGGFGRSGQRGCIKTKDHGKADQPEQSVVVCAVIGHMLSGVFYSLSHRDPV